MFLKSSNLNIMSEFSIFLALINFILLIVRRSFVELIDFSSTRPSVSFYISISAFFLFASFPVSRYFDSGFTLCIYMSVFLFGQLILDPIRFSGKRNHVFFLLIQLTSIFLLFASSFLGYGILNILLLISSIQSLSALIIFHRIALRKIGLVETLRRVNLIRGLDFTISSGFGFLLPLIAAVILSNSSVGILRTSQNFLSVGSVFTSAVYYSSLQKSSRRKVPNYFIFGPSIILFLILASLNSFLSRHFQNLLFGPYFKDSVVLTSLLIVALIPNIFASNLNASIVSLGLFKPLMKIHLVVLLLLALGSIFGFMFYDIRAFGFFSVLAGTLEVFLTRKLLGQVHD